MSKERHVKVVMSFGRKSSYRYEIQQQISSIETEELDNEQIQFSLSAHIALITVCWNFKIEKFPYHRCFLFIFKSLNKNVVDILLFVGMG